MTKLNWSINTDGSYISFRMSLLESASQCGEKYLTAKVAKEIEHRIQTKTKEKWDKTISVSVDALPEGIAV